MIPGKNRAKIGVVRSLVTGRMVTHLVAAATICSLAGCARPKAGPLDDNNLGLMVVSEKHRPELEDLTTRRTFAITAQQASALVEALRPIKSVEVGNLPSGEADYVLSYQAAMDPLVLRVQLNNETLLYCEREYCYEGGDAQGFARIVDRLTTASNGKSARH